MLLEMESSGALGVAYESELQQETWGRDRTIRQAEESDRSCKGNKVKHGHVLPRARPVPAKPDLMAESKNMLNENSLLILFSEETIAGHNGVSI